MNRKVCAEFRQAFADVAFDEDPLLADYILCAYSQKGETFIVIIDEYDVLMRERAGEKELEVYRAFLNSLFKARELMPAISLAYLTGILPIMKDKVQSKLNIFCPYTMLYADDFAEFVGFTAGEVKALCEKYGCDFELCKSWYDGYRLGGWKSITRSPSSRPFRSPSSSPTGAARPPIMSLTRR